MEFKENYTQQLQRLNEYQKAAVFDESSACLVNANVGSGKTTVLITKVMYLHYEKQIPYEQMVVLTFTNKAADEIKERLYALEPEITEEQLWGFGTFHSVCLTMLKKMLPVEKLGYTKEFLDEKFDSIVDFAELHDFMDMPLKNYSSGMVARIAFAIATATNPDILIVDEILSVGDYLFQQKCEKRIKELMDAGVAIILVSHSAGQIEAMCDRALWIEKSIPKMIGPAKEVCAAYQSL